MQTVANYSIIYHLRRLGLNNDVHRPNRSVRNNCPWQLHSFDFKTIFSRVHDHRLTRSNLVQGIYCTYATAAGQIPSPPESCRWNSAPAPPARFPKARSGRARSRSFQTHFRSGNLDSFRESYRPYWWRVLSSWILWTNATTTVTLAMWSGYFFYFME